MPTIIKRSDSDYPYVCINIYRNKLLHVQDYSSLPIRLNSIFKRYHEFRNVNEINA